MTRYLAISSDPWDGGWSYLGWELGLPCMRSWFWISIRTEDGAELFIFGVKAKFPSYLPLPTHAQLAPQPHQLLTLPVQVWPSMLPLLPPCPNFTRMLLLYWLLSFVFKIFTALQSWDLDHTSQKCSPVLHPQTPPQAPWIRDSWVGPSSLL